MASTQQVARAAAQLHEAAQDVARVAVRRTTQAVGQITMPFVPPQLVEGQARQAPEGHDESDCSPASMAGPVVPEKPKHAVGQLTTAELVRERMRLEAALRRPFSDDIKALLQGRLDAVLAEQADRARRRAEGIAAAKARRAAAGGT